jgi:uncharacterized membrane-anchored protein
MAKKVITQDQKDARALLIVVASGLLFVPAMNLLFKALAFFQFVAFGYVQ